MGVRPHPSIIESYVRGFKTHGPTPLALGWTKDKQDIRYKALVKDIQRNQSLLDFGCGLAHLRGWLLRNRMKSVYYHGVDVVKEFVDCAPEDDDRRYRVRRIFNTDDITRDYDHVVMCGVFNRRALCSETMHRENAYSTIRTLLTRTRIGLHVDFLRADTADFREKGAAYFHPEAIVKLLRDSIPGSRFSLDCSYLPYEFCVHIYKNDIIQSPKNIYQESL
jgi:hypothetical protein